MPQCEVSVVIVNFNSGQLLIPNLQALRQHSSPALEVVVVDCASPLDQTPYLAQARALGARVIEADRNLGYAGGCNLGLAETSGPIVAFANADVEVLGDVAGELSELLDRHEDVAIAAPRAYHDADRAFSIPNFHPVHRRALVDEALRAVSGRYAFWRSIRRARSRVAFWRQTGVSDHANLHGAFLMARRQTFASIGPFDEDYPLYYEDTDLFVRARRAGYRLVCQHRSAIVHRIHRSSATVWSEAMSKLETGRRRFVRRQLGPISDWFDRTARRATARWPARPARKSEDLGELSSPPTFAWEADAEQALVELAFGPHFIEAIGHFVAGIRYRPSERVWLALSPGDYFARVVTLPDFEEVRRWRFRRARSDSTDGSGKDGSASSVWPISGSGCS